MTKFLMVQDPGTTDLSWEFPFSMDSERMALDYAKRIACQLNRNLNLFNQDLGTLVAEIKVTTESRATAYAPKASVA